MDAGIEPSRNDIHSAVVRRLSSMTRSGDIRVVVVEDDAGMREGLATLIDGTNGYSCSGLYGMRREQIPGPTSKPPRAGNTLSPQATYFQVTVRGGSPRGTLSTTSTFAPRPADSNSNL